jgi:hypothetical protein
MKKRRNMRLLICDTLPRMMQSGFVADPTPGSGPRQIFRTGAGQALAALIAGDERGGGEH